MPEFKSKKTMAILIPVVILILGIVIFAFHNKIFNTDQKTDKADIEKDLNIVAVIGDRKITKTEFDNFKALYPTDKVPSDTELINTTVEREVLYQEAVKEKFSVTEDEVNKAFQQQKEAAVQYGEDIKGLVKKQNITEEEYWKRMKNSIKKDLIIGKYKRKLKEDFSKDNPDLPSNQYPAKYKEYYNNKIESLKKTIGVKIFIK
ncbi:MAG: SurA N-terminal domain-containing protein [Bacillota bacterium]|nr:SurA N-terminal domain-containing protein [Bacillota bacterium]